MPKTADDKTLGVPGRARAIAKRMLEEALWGRVRLARATRKPPPLPAPAPPTDLLRTVEEWQESAAECKKLGLPRHFTGEKNWDVLGSVSTILHELGTDLRVLDAGAARYSTVLPSLAIYRVRELVGNNLEFRRTTSHGGVRFEPGDITDTPYRDGYFDAVTCLSVVEHGVPVSEFLAECARILRPGGLLVVSTDYRAVAPDTSGKLAYGVPVHIFDRAEILDLVQIAKSHGLTLQGQLELDGADDVVDWKRIGVKFTFIRLTFVRE